METVSDLFVWAWLLFTLLFASTFIQRTRVAAAKWGFRYRRLRWGSAIAAVLALLIVGATAPAPKSSSSAVNRKAVSLVPEVVVPPSLSIAHELATIDAGGYVSEDDIRVVRFRSLLRQLTETYDLTAQQIADQTVKAQEMLRKEGVQDSLVDLMTGMNQLFSTRQEGKQYAEALASYVVLREKGTSPDDAFHTIQALARLNESEQTGH